RARAASPGLRWRARAPRRASRRAPSRPAVASRAGRGPRASRRGSPEGRAAPVPAPRRPRLPRQEEPPVERELHLLDGEALGALDLDGRVHAAVDPVELVDEEVGVAQAQVLEEAALVLGRDALDLDDAPAEHGGEDPLAGVAAELRQLALVGAGEEPEPHADAGVGQRGLEAVPGSEG